MTGGASWLQTISSIGNAGVGLAGRDRNGRAVHSGQSGHAAASDTTFQLWPEPAPSKLNATVDFFTNPSFEYAYLSSSTDELLFTLGRVQAHLDRPRTATGGRFPYRSVASLLLNQTHTGTGLFVVGGRADERKVIVPVALENALIGVDAPDAFTLVGSLQGTQMGKCVAGFTFDLRWLLPTLPDPYAANFNLSLIRGEGDSPSAGTVLAETSWSGQTAIPQLAFVLLPPADAAGNATGTPLPSVLAPTNTAVVVGRQPQVMDVALLDLSTRVDLFGVALAPQIGALLGRGQGNIAGVGNITANAGTTSAAPEVAFSGMSLALNGAAIATFALPQFSWEPMESTAVDQSGPIMCDPAYDGFPLLVASPNNQQLIPFAPAPVLVNNVENVAAGTPFAALFSLPFGLNAVIIQGNEPSRKKPGVHSTFLLEGGRFGPNVPRFPNSLPASPPVAAATPKPGSSPTPPKVLTGALTLSLMPEHPELSNATFPGFTQIDATGPAPGYGTYVLGFDPTTQASDVADIFAGEFSESAPTHAVPLRRIDFSGYGASTFSEWIDSNVSGPAVTKVQFEASIGRTALEVIQVVSVIYPYCIQVVRTITMQRQNAGWVKRTDSGWQAASAGTFKFPADVASQYNGRVHPGAFTGAYNVRNIRDEAQTVSVKAPANAADPEAGKTFEFRQVLFDADLVVDKSLNVTSGGFPAENSGGPAGFSAVASRDMVGYLQLSAGSAFACCPRYAGVVVRSNRCTESRDLVYGRSRAFQQHGRNRVALLRIRCEYHQPDGEQFHSRSRRGRGSARSAADSSRGWLEHGTAPVH